MLDGLSFVRALREQGAKLEGARVLQVGAGGVGSAIAVALLEAGVSELRLYDIDQARVDELAGKLGKLGCGKCSAVERPDPSGCDVVANATSMGMKKEDPCPVPADLLTSRMFVGDVVAGHGTTPLLEAAQAIGCKVADGVQMVEAGMKLMPDFLLHAMSS